MRSFITTFFETQGSFEIITCMICFFMCVIFGDWAIALFFVLMGLLSLGLFILSKRGSK